ncbi:hypothetical protein DFH06DRAFT_173419 [Mycena polygramma]|nr:hypothetical protein DFH06DRAFT_173419 [Mycena polygramma]
MSQPNSVLAIPELLDLIIAPLSGSKEDLYACALVSRLWMQCSRYHIFSTIKLPQTYTGDNEEANRRAIARLDETFKASPYLAAFVRAVEFSVELSVLAFLADTPLPNLHAVTVHCTWPQRRDRRDRAAVPYIQCLLRIPSVDKVSLYGVYPSFTVLNAYFAGCSRRITTVKGILSSWLNEATAVEDEIELVDSRSIPPPLDLVTISASMNCRKWFNHWRCPFAFGNLTTIVTEAAFWPTLCVVVARSLPNLKNLKLKEFHDAAHVDISVLPMLRVFKVSFKHTNPSVGFDALLTVLAALSPQNHLCLLEIRPCVLKPVDEPAVRQLDATLAALGTTVIHEPFRVAFPLPVEAGVEPTVVPIPDVVSWMPQVSASRWRLDVTRR